MLAGVKGNQPMYQIKSGLALNPRSLPPPLTLSPLPHTLA